MHASPRAWQMTSPSRFSAAAVTARVASGWLRVLSEGCESDNRVCLTTTAAQRCQAILNARPTSSEGADHKRAPVQERQVGSPPVAAGRGAAAVSAAASRPAPAPTAAATAGASGRRAAAASAAAVFQARRGGVRGAALQWRQGSPRSAHWGVWDARQATAHRLPRQRQRLAGVHPAAQGGGASVAEGRPAGREEGSHGRRGCAVQHAGLHGDAGGVQRDGAEGMHRNGTLEAPEMRRFRSSTETHTVSAPRRSE